MSLGGHRFLRKPAVLVSLLLLGGCATATPVASLADGKEGEIAFQTLTISGRDFARGVREGPPVVISGDLMLPPGSGRAPAVIITHGSSGVTGAETGWAQELLKMGHGVFLVDSFTARGIRRAPPEEELSRVGQVLDVYRALELLETHPRIDPARIWLMGFSRGGGLTLLASVERYREAQLRERAGFAGFLAFYPSIIPGFDYGALSKRPIRIFHGTADDATPIGRVREFAEKQKVAGANVRLYEYPGAHHSFDNPEIRQPIWLTMPNASYTVAYHARAHAQAIRDVREILSASETREIAR